MGIEARKGKWETYKHETIIKSTWQKNEKLNPVIIAISTALRGDVKQIRSARRLKIPLLFNRALKRLRGREREPGTAANGGGCGRPPHVGGLIRPEHLFYYFNYFYTLSSRNYLIFDALAVRPHRGSLLPRSKFDCPCITALITPITKRFSDKYAGTARFTTFISRTPFHKI